MTQLDSLDLLRRQGRCVPQPVSDWAGQLPLPPQIAQLYQQVGPTQMDLRWIGNPITLSPLSALWEMQTGYRWHGITKDPVANWPDTWLVIAQEGGNPFIFDIPTGRVLFGLAGAGHWDGATVLFADLHGFIAAVAQLSTLVNEAAGFFNDDFEIAPQHLGTARSKLIEITGATDQAEHVLATLGWVY